VIFGRDRAKFAEAPEVAWLGKKICVRGVIESYKDKPQIVVKSGEDVSLSEGQPN
jgi:DNA/RNA endonuclease YhcR with UshA esterase domain